MRKQVILISGQSSSLKTTIMKELVDQALKGHQLHIPEHYTTRDRRSDDDDFYTFVNQSQGSRCLVESGAGNHIYGILKDEFLFDDSLISIMIPSLKDIDSLRNFAVENKINLTVIVLFSSRFQQKLAYSDRYDEKELSYRLHTNMLDLLQYNYRSTDLVFDVDTVKVYEIIDRIIEKIKLKEKKYVYYN